VQPPRQKRLPSGSYESWRLHRSRFKQSAHWKKAFAFSQTPFRKISKCKHTENSTRRNISSKRRSESESHYEGKLYRQQERINTKNKSENKDKNYDQSKTQNLKNVKVKALTMIKAKQMARVNKVKAIEKTPTGPRIKRKKQLNQKIGPEPTSTLPSCFTAMFNISIFIYILTIFIFENFISISNLIVSDPSDHPFQTFTVGKLSDCKTFCLS
jgi:hypothetical protein